MYYLAMDCWFLLLVIDIYCILAWVVRVKDKKGETFAKVFQKIIEKPVE